MTQVRTGVYRPNVGIVLFDAQGRVWLGRRSGMSSSQNWQFPQGGIDPGEAAVDAARRELAEETGVTSAVLMAEAPDPITYDFPAGMKGSKAMRGFKGQRQTWFAFRFEGDDSEVDLNAHGEPEFDAWRWASMPEALKTVASFKRKAYEEVLAVFGHLAAPS